MKVNEPKLKDIPIVRKFPYVFSKDLSGLPSFHKVEFRIDLVPEAIPIAKSPYRLAPTKCKNCPTNLKSPKKKVSYDLALHLGEPSSCLLRRRTVHSVWKNKKFDWGDEQKITFLTLKDMLCDAPILALLEGEDDFLV
nr:putative reverse transcriptase domain-containing protein [Tanacetum cinerariifolium]